MAMMSSCLISSDSRPMPQRKLERDKVRFGKPLSSLKVHVFARSRPCVIGRLGDVRLSFGKMAEIGCFPALKEDEFDAIESPTRPGAKQMKQWPGTEPSLKK